MSSTLVRICGCGAENEFNTFLCKKCGSSIAHISPCERAVKEKQFDQSSDDDHMMKKCPNCDLENNQDNIVCSKCSHPLDMIEAHQKNQADVVEQDTQNLQDTDSKPRESHLSATIMESICLISNKDGAAIQCKNGDILGREGTIMKKYFRQYGTVSNIHAKITLKAELWNIMDLNSSNGTFLNHTKLSPNEEYPLKQNDLLRLSSRLEFIVK